MQNENKKVESNKVTETKENRSVSPMYAATRFANTAKFLKENNFIDEDDTNKLKEVHTKLVQRFIGLDLFK